MVSSKIIYHHKRKRIDAHLEVKDNKFILKSGSHLSSEITSKVETIKKLRKNHSGSISNNKTIADIEFNNPSAASQFVCGASSNGRTDWVDDNEIPINDHLRKSK